MAADIIKALGETEVDTNNSSGRITWRSPSNIALVKYWGKYAEQYPRNTSVSFTLTQAYTETTLEYGPRQDLTKGIGLDFFFEGKEAPPVFRDRILKYLNRLSEIMPSLGAFDFKINSSNSFPHSSGIASSASSMSALALCICSLAQKLGLLEADDFFKAASYLARLGSGSACRSVFPMCAIWGELPTFPSASNDYAVPFLIELHPTFKSFNDDILIISSGRKSVSSSAGHALMEHHKYADRRFETANQNLVSILKALENGDLEVFGQILEEEALTLHALMMNSNPPFILMKPNTLLAIQKVWNFRKDTNIPLFFTLDAGPNLHLLYPDEYKRKVHSFIAGELIELCENENWLKDHIGNGPFQILS